jgi:hypothetical protein
MKKNLSQKNVINYHQEKPQILNPNLQNAKSEDNTNADNIEEKHNNNTNEKKQVPESCNNRPPQNAQRNNNNSMDGNCSNAKETVVSINTTGEEKQTTKERQTQENTQHKKKLY